ncbi:hypothetical protein [Stenotrophomonas sp. Y-13]|uniref:hypothetical protein n=1 Tax=Stenotrophomonas sp. Y-13 TaxID=3384161 RepID=UPI0039176560
MTINIALATYDSIVLGCDSLSSMVDSVIFPFAPGTTFAQDANGNFITDKDGNYVIAFDQRQVSQVATTVFGGVSKMFCVYDSQSDEDDGIAVGAVTAGLAILGGVTIAEHAKRFRRSHKNVKFETVEAVATAFCQHFCNLWDAEFSDVGETQRGYLPTIQFIVAGYGKDDEYGKVFKIDVQARSLQEQFPGGDHAGICWGGMANYVERLTRGVDQSLVYTATKQVAAAIAAQRVSVLTDISRALAAAGIELPEGLRLDITEQTEPTLPWDSQQADIDFGNLSTQYAVELVELLVNTQSGMQRFARGIPTVGGRTHIGVLKRGEGFRLLNEPQLQHLHTGYSHDF